MPSYICKRCGWTISVPVEKNPRFCRQCGSVGMVLKSPNEVDHYVAAPPNIAILDPICSFFDVHTEEPLPQPLPSRPAPPSTTQANRTPTSIRTSARSAAKWGNGTASYPAQPGQASCRRRPGCQARSAGRPAGQSAQRVASHGVHRSRRCAESCARSATASTREVSHHRQRRCALSAQMDQANEAGWQGFARPRRQHDLHGQPG